MLANAPQTINYRVFYEEYLREILLLPKRSPESLVANAADTVQRSRSRGVLHLLGRH
jgi:hypothetical protein